MRSRSRALLLLAVLAVGAGCLALLDAFDLPSRARDALRPWVVEVFRIEPAAAPEPQAPPKPRWTRPVDSQPLAPEDTPWHLVAGAAAGGEVGSARVALDGVTRRAVEGRVPHRFSLEVDAPAQAELWLALNQRLSPLSAAGIRYRVRGRTADGGTRLLLDAERRAWQLGWRELRLDLAPLGAGRIVLDFEAVPVEPGAAGPDAFAYWGDLRLRSPGAGHPDLVVVLIDTLRADHLGAYGYARPTSPYIDRLAAEGLRFDRVVASAPWTDPSMLSVMTGLYPRDVWKPAPHQETGRWTLPDGAPTLASALADAGYHAIAASDHPSIVPWRFGAGFDVFSELYLPELHRVPGAWRKTDQRTLLTRVERLLEGRATGPVFFYLHLLYPHRPLAPPDAFLEAVGASLDSAGPMNYGHVPDFDVERDRYDAEIRVADAVVEQLHGMLARQGFDEDTILVVLSDHGEGFLEHGYHEHGNSLYNELLLVPWIVYAPGRVPAGSVVPDLVRQVDVLPTLLELAGVEPVSGIRGESALPLLDGPGPERIGYSEFPYTRIVEGYALQSGEAKRVFGDPELAERPWFDLRDDAAEARPGASAPAGAPDLAAAAERIRGAPTLGPREGAGPGPETLEALEALGYAE